MSAKTETVFYSWQSDSPGRYNRHFLEEAIADALASVRKGMALDSSPRDLKLERDTLDEPGSPPVTDTILRKIDACSAFVADLTVVGHTFPELNVKKGAKLFPNPNVVMEYGYALKTLGHRRLVAVTNEAFGGEVRESSLPFNLRHRRWPIRYNLGPNTPAGEKPTIKARLVKELTNAISLILRESKPSNAAPPFVQNALGPDDFIQMANAHELIVGGPFGEDMPSYGIPGRGILTLRLHPPVKVPEFDSEADAQDAAWTGNLLPMAGYIVAGRSPARNAAGGIIFQGPVQGRLVSLTQLFLSKEIFGLDAASSGSNMWRNANEARPVLDIGQVEESFAITLRSYAAFARRLALPAPWTVRAGVHGVKGHQLHAGTQCLKSEIIWSTTMLPDAAVLDVLDPFFDLLWRSFGSRRPAGSKQHLRQMLAELDSHG